MKPTIYIHSENTARYDAVYRHLYKFSAQNGNFNLSIIQPNITNNLPIQANDYLLILGENDIAQYGYDHYVQIFQPHQCIYPARDAFQLEASKAFTRDFIAASPFSGMNPTYEVLDNKMDINFSNLTYKNTVIKADGLASGKGVFVWSDHFKNDSEGVAIVRELFTKHDKIVIEDKLVGREFSLISLIWGKNIQHFPIVLDFKRLNNNDKGPNTGGMGTISFPYGQPSFLTEQDLTQCYNLNTYVAKTTNYQGFLYGSFIKTTTGEIKMIEYNCRLGDSEAVNIFGLLQSSIYDFLTGQDIAMKINVSSYTYFRYIVPKGYPTLESSPENPYIIANLNKISCDNIYLANSKIINKDCYSDSQDGYTILKMTKSRAIGIFTISDDLDIVVSQNDNLIKSIIGDVHYRTDIGNNLKNLATQSSGTLNYLAHLDNYNHLITNAKKYIDSCNEEIAAKYNGQMQLIGKIGDFANSVQYGNVKLICSIDGAGTKTKFLEGMPNRFHTLGKDIVTHNVNDMLCNNGTPIAVLDYYGCDKLDKNEFAQFIDGVMIACCENLIPLIGGETAEMRGIFIDGEIEVLGVVLGMILDDKFKNGEKIQGGEYLYGIGSRGAHTNGYTKLREIDAKVGGMPKEIKEFFAQPHRNYTEIVRMIKQKICEKGLAWEDVIVGMAHITGGGFEDNIGRLFKYRLPNLQLNLRDWRQNLPISWNWLYENAELSWDNFIRVFNAGWGFVLVTNRELGDDIIGDFGHDIMMIGRIC